MKIDLVNLQRQYQHYKDEIDAAMQKVLDSSNYILGREVKIFEEKFADFCDAKYCVGVASGTDALLISLKALGIKEGDEVITAPNSFFATALAVSMVGARPVFADINPQTYNIDPLKIAEKITVKTKAIIPVHLFGQPVDIDPIKKIAQKHGLKILEDACQAHGARYNGRRVGTFGDIAAFSFFPGKNLGAYGDGGGIITNNKDLAEKAFLYHVYGGKDKYNYSMLGFNSRLDTLQAAILTVKLKYLDEWTDKRRQNAELYNKFLSGLPVITPMVLDNTLSAFHLYVIKTDKRDNLMKYLNSKGVATGVHYPIPIHLQAAYKELGYNRGDFPNTEMASDQILSLPMCPELREDEIKYIAQTIKEFFKNEFNGRK